MNVIEIELSNDEMVRCNQCMTVLNKLVLKYIDNDFIPVEYCPNCNETGYLQDLDNSPAD